jgi:hypothetical protein
VLPPTPGVLGVDPPGPAPGDEPGEDEGEVPGPPAVGLIKFDEDV